MMTVRRVFLATVCASLVAASTAQAQHAAFETGNWLISGSAGLSRNHTDGSKLIPNSDVNTTSLGISPSLLYFFTPQLALGASASLGHSSTGTSNGDIKTTSFGVGPAVRYYFVNTPNNLRPYAAASVDLTHSKTTSKSSAGANIESSSNSIDPDVAVGFSYMLSDDVGILNELYYTRQSTKSKVDVPAGTTVESKGYAFGLRFGLNIILH